MELPLAKTPIVIVSGLWPVQALVPVVCVGGCDALLIRNSKCMAASKAIVFGFGGPRLATNMFVSYLDRK